MTFLSQLHYMDSPQLIKHLIIHISITFKNHQFLWHKGIILFLDNSMLKIVLLCFLILQVFSKLPFLDKILISINHSTNQKIYSSTMGYLCTHCDSFLPYGEGPASHTKDDVSKERGSLQCGHGTIVQDVVVVWLRCYTNTVFHCQNVQLNICKVHIMQEVVEVWLRHCANTETTLFYCQNVE